MEGESHLTRAELLSCLELSKALTAELDSDRLLDTIFQKVSALLPAENWSLLLLDEEKGELRFQLSVDLDLEMVKGFRLPLGEGIAGQVALEQKPIIVPDVRESEFFSKAVDQLSGFESSSIICVPVIFGGRTLGVIEVVNPRSLESRALALLELIADYTAIAVENARRYKRIRKLAIQDDLTGLYNTRHLYRSLTDLIAACENSSDCFSIIFMDMDDFKYVVDTYGHLKGSQALQEVAGTIRESLSETAYGVAYGGDEFVVVLPGYGKSEGLQKAEEIRVRMRQTVYLSNHGHEVYLRASFGVATFPDDATELKELLSVADRTMFDVKGEGKDAVAG
jgi:diguanylate cyclase (GGDEF)-like protein